MTLSDPAVNVRARTQNHAARPVERPTSVNAPRRPNLRVIDGRTQTTDTPPPAIEDHTASNHWDAATGALSGHETTSTVPPTAAEAAGQLWLAREEVRHGLAGQLAAAAAGLAQTLGLLACWWTAHTLFSTRTRAAIFALMLVLSLTTCAITSHA